MKYRLVLDFDVEIKDPDTKGKVLDSLFHKHQGKMKTILRKHGKVYRWPKLTKVRKGGDK